MSKTHYTRASSANPVTTGQIVEGFRAKYYDIGNSPLGLPFVTRPHVRLITIQPGQSILDIGCGTGEVLYQLHKRLGDAIMLHGIDPSNDMLDVARQKLRKAANAKLELGIGEQLQFSDAHSFPQGHSFPYSPLAAFSHSASVGNRAISSEDNFFA